MSNTLVLFNHFPKTGGTTISHILQRELCGGVKNLLGDEGYSDEINIKRRVIHSLKQSPEQNEPIHCILRGWQDWFDLKNELGNLSNRPTIVLEGAVWGVDNIFSKTHQHKYVTTLRNPYAVFRSNFSYSKQRYSLHSSFDEYLPYYGHNLFTAVLGHGDLSTAKTRLNDFFCSFVVLEAFENSLSVLADRLDLSDVSYGVRNKSGSENFELSPRQMSQFNDLNSDDFTLYNYALELVERRARNIRGTAMLPKNIYSEQYPEDHINKSGAIIKAIESKKISEAINMMEILPVKDFGVLHNLGKMLYRVGRHSESRGYLSQAFEVQPSVVFDDLIECLRNINQDEAINLFAREISKVDSLVEGTMHDSLVRKDAISLRRNSSHF